MARKKSRTPPAPLPQPHTVRQDTMVIVPVTATIRLPISLLRFILVPFCFQHPEHGPADGGGRGRLTLATEPAWVVSGYVDNRLVQSTFAFLAFNADIPTAFVCRLKNLPRLGDVGVGAPERRIAVVTRRNILYPHQCSRAINSGIVPAQLRERHQFVIRRLPVGHCRSPRWPKKQGRGSPRFDASLAAANLQASRSLALLYSKSRWPGLPRQSSSRSRTQRLASTTIPLAAAAASQRD